MFRECKPCNKIICPEISRCDYKYTGDCGCCTYCARSESGRCGGALNMWGSCGPGLKCVYRIGSVFNEERFGFCETGDLFYNIQIIVVIICIRDLCNEDVWI